MAQTDKKAIIAIIQKRRSGGLTDEQIFATLVNQGYTDEQINGLIEESYKEPVAEVEEAGEKPKKRSWWPF